MKGFEPGKPSNYAPVLIHKVQIRVIIVLVLANYICPLLITYNKLTTFEEHYKFE